MKNGNLPAMPVSTSESICQMTGTLKPEFAGLTKREMFAMAAMQGICASGPTITNALIALEAVALAGALLAELEKTK
jgi:hypothetical protein